MYGETVFVAYSSLQKCISLSSSKAEFIALFEATKTVVCLQNVLIALDINQEPMKVVQEKWRYM